MRGFAEKRTFFLYILSHTKIFKVKQIPLALM